MEHLSEDFVSTCSKEFTKSSSDSRGNISDHNFDSDEVSCFLCSTRCSSKAQFLAHFVVHFRNGRRERRKTVTKVLPATTSDDDTTSDADNDVTEGQKSRLKHRRKRPKLASLMKKSGKVPDQNLQATDPDVDSGCHSGDEDGSSSSPYTNRGCFSDCLGDSESSDEEDKLAAPIRSYSQAKGSIVERLSLAEKQLDNNETENLLCQTCLKRFSNCQNLRRHLRLHISRDSVTPDIDRASKRSSCDASDDSFFDGKYFCDWCPARFGNRSAARVHEGTHKGHETKCYVCDKSYADRYTLRYHLRTHGIGRQIRCEFCNKSFSKPSRLEAHIKSHHKNIRDFSCQQCDKKFKTRVHLRNHLQRHSDERPFACSVCSDRFRHKASLVAHMRGHVGSRPYCCEICGKTFREPSTLKAHCRVHSGDKPYRCDLCDKAFTQRAGLNYHKRGHSSSEVNAKGDEAQGAGFPDAKMPSSLPSPPIQYGDATFQSSPLPSFDHLKPTASPSASPSSLSSSSESFMYPVRRDKSFDLDEYSQDVTPPQTPPSTSTTSSSSSAVNVSRSYGIHAANHQESLLQTMNLPDYTHQMDFNSNGEVNFYQKNYIQPHDQYRQHVCQHQTHLAQDHLTHQQQQHHQTWFQHVQYQNDMHQSPNVINEYLNHPYDFNGMTSGYSQVTHHNIMDNHHYNSYPDTQFHETNQAVNLQSAQTQSSGYCL